MVLDHNFVGQVFPSGDGSHLGCLGNGNATVGVDPDLVGAVPDVGGNDVEIAVPIEISKSDAMGAIGA